MTAGRSMRRFFSFLVCFQVLPGYQCLAGPNLASAEDGVRVSPSASRPGDSLLHGLVAYYPLSGDAGDKSGNRHHGTVNGNPEAVSGAVGGGYYFHGSLDENVRVDGFPHLEDAISISAWVKRGGSGRQPLFSKGSYGDNEPFVIWISPDSVTFQINNHSGNCGASYPMSAERYEHIVCTYDRNIARMRVYINGTLVGESEYGDKLNREPDDVLFMAVSLPGGLEHFTRSLDEVWIFRRALTAGEVRQLYALRKEQDLFAQTWTYLSVVGDVIEIDFGGGTTRAVRKGVVFESPDGESATVVAIDPARSTIVVRREPDGREQEIRRRTGNGPM